MSPDNSPESRESLYRTGTLVVFNLNDEKYLLLLQSVSRPGEWEIPGGEINGIVSSHEAEREVLEEAGLVVNAIPCLPDSSELTPYLPIVTGKKTPRTLVPFVYQSEIDAVSLPEISLCEHTSYGYIKLPTEGNKPSIVSFYGDLNQHHLNLADRMGNITKSGIQLSDFTDMAVRRYVGKILSHL